MNGRGSQISLIRANLNDLVTPARGEFGCRVRADAGISRQESAPIHTCVRRGRSGGARKGLIGTRQCRNANKLVQKPVETCEGLLVGLRSKQFSRGCGDEKVGKVPSRSPALWHVGFQS